MLRLLRRALRRPHRRLRRVEMAFLDAYARGGARAGHALVLLPDWFLRPAVRAHVLGWLNGDHALDAGLLRREWRAARPPPGAEDAHFFENLATLASMAYDLRPYGAPTRGGQPRFADARSHHSR